jgi:hypothetical protein
MTMRGPLNSSPYTANVHFLYHLEGDLDEFRTSIWITTQGILRVLLERYEGFLGLMAEIQEEMAESTQDLRDEAGIVELLKH